MKFFWIQFWCFVIGISPVLAADSAPQTLAPRTLVECGAFVKIYDPSVGEKEPWYINDHCFIQDQSGTWHLFGITRQEPAKPEEEINFAHATAKTLLQQPWDKQPFALTVARSAPWNETHLWAPYVIVHDNLYYMFYCAGDQDHTKYKINLATSPDLKTWTRSPKNPMVVDGYDARDPFVLRVKDKWVMYYDATSKPAGGNHVVAYVTSDDLLTWTNRGIAFTDPTTGTWGGPTESPFVVQRGDAYYLFIGPRDGYDGTDVFVSRDPFHWDIRDKVGHFPAHAAEIVRDTDGQWYISRAGWERGGVYLAPLIWKDGKSDLEKSTATNRLSP
ncbi:MAG TPA: glycosyl hydrolase family 32 [Verrucomicrobiae bacterium]|nr:glycosyl hydrolase family 32 [Verrucomicrobiae bacterium]